MSTPTTRRPDEPLIGQTGLTLRQLQSGILSAGQVARLCRVAPRTVTKWCDMGKLPSYLIPLSKERRVLVTDALRFLREYRMPQATWLEAALGWLGVVVGASRELTALLPASVQHTTYLFNLAWMLDGSSPGAALFDLGGLGRGETLAAIRAVRLRFGSLYRLCCLLPADAGSELAGECRAAGADEVVGMLGLAGEPQRVLGLIESRGGAV